MEGESAEKEFLDLLEVDSIRSWADEVDSEINSQCEAESESQSAEGIAYNPKYAYQAQKLQESMPPSNSDESHIRREHQDYRSRGNKRTHGTSKYQWRPFPHQQEDEGRQNKYQSHPRWTGGSPRHRHDNGDSHDKRSPHGRYRRDKGGLSPLRSPITTRPRSAELNRRRNYRRRRPGESHSMSRVLSGIDEHALENTELNGTPSHSQTVLVDEDDGGTPILSRWHMKDPARARSRRRLSLPDDMQENDSGQQVDEITEDDDERLARREKDIAYGKQTASYQKYIQLISLETRNEDKKIHPRTPLKTQKCSRRSWDGQIRCWKKRLHAWASDTAEFLSTQVTETPATEGPRWADVVAGTSAPKDQASNSDKEAETSSIDPNIDEDESFLTAGLELDCDIIVDQLNDSIKLDDTAAVENVNEEAS